MIQFDKPNKLTLRDLQGLSKPVTRFEIIVLLEKNRSI